MLYALDPSLCHFTIDGEPTSDATPLGLHFRYGMRTPQHLHYGPKDAGAVGKDCADKQSSQYCCVMTLGHIVDQRVSPRLYQQRGGQKNLRAGSFYPWPILQGRSAADALDAAHLIEGRAELDQRPPTFRLSIAERMFITKHWPDVGVAREPTVTEGEEVMSKKYNFKVLDYKMCWERAVNKGGEQVLEYQGLTNFELYKYKAIYQYADNTSPTHVVSCRWKNPNCDDGTVVNVKTGEMGPNGLDGVQFVIIDVSIALNLVLTSAQLKTTFNNAWPRLNAMNLELDMFMNYLQEMVAPTPTSAITHFGKQASGVYVYGNMCHQDGLLLTHEQANVAVIKDYFTSKSYHPSSYPAIKIVPYPHVRYTLALNIWNDIYPSVFGNNEMEAKAMLAIGIMGLHADRFWNGEAGLSKFPVTLAVSNMAGTGKTLALGMVHALHGLVRSPIMSACSTTVAFQMKLGFQRCGMVCSDDYVPPKGYDGKMAELIRMIYERTARSIGGDKACTRNIESPMMMTSNSYVCQHDTAVQGRMYQIEFGQLGHSEGLIDLNHAQSLISCTAQDWCQLLADNGKLDREVIGDCVTFLYQAVGFDAPDRRTATWGWLLYYFLTISWICQAPSGDAERIIEWVVNRAREAAFDTTQENHTVTRFLVAFAKVMPGGAMAARPLFDKPHEVIFWHNYRTGQKLNVDHQLATTVADHDDSDRTYVALRLQSVCYAIKKATGQFFDHKRVAQALIGWGANNRDAVPTNTCQFALTTNWPLFRLAGDVGQTYKVALEESEVRGDELLGPSSSVAMLICEEKFKQVLAENVEGAQLDEKYKDIMIMPFGHSVNGSELPGMNVPYNFYKMAVGLDQYDPVTKDLMVSHLFRAAHNTPYGAFCGAGNHINGTVRPEIETLNEYHGYGTIDDVMHVKAMDSHFGYNFPDPEVLPPAYTKMPYNTRDDPSLGDFEIPEPCTYHPDQLSSIGSDCGFSQDDFYDEPYSPAHSSMGTFSPRNSNDDYQSEKEMPSPANPGHGGSNPLADISNMRNQPHGEGRPTGSLCDMAIGEAAMDDDNAELERELEMELQIQRELEQEGVLEDNFAVSIHSLEPKIVTPRHQPLRYPYYWLLGHFSYAIIKFILSSPCTEQDYYNGNEPLPTRYYCMNDGCEEERDEASQVCQDCKNGLGALHDSSLSQLRSLAAADALAALAHVPEGPQGTMGPDNLVPINLSGPWQPLPEDDADHEAALWLYDENGVYAPRYHGP